MDISTPEGLAQAIAWQERMVAHIRDGGSWVVPRSGTLVRIDHSTKTATFQLGLISEPDIKKVFRAMGWIVQPDDSDEMEFAE
jgi:hypothetical protein